MTDKKTGFDLISELEHLMLTVDAIPIDDETFEDEFNRWLKCLEATLEQTSDKMLNYRRVLSLAKKRKEFFAEERNRYAARFRVQSRIVERVKEFAHMLLESYANTTGKDKMVLEDGTWAKLAKRKDFVFYNAQTGETRLDPQDVPACFVKMEISKSELKRAAKSGEDIPGVNYEQVEKTHVRWS